MTSDPSSNNYSPRNTALHLHASIGASRMYDERASTLGIQGTYSNSMQSIISSICRASFLMLSFVVDITFFYVALIRDFISVSHKIKKDNL